ncbi:MAG: hypothetical protein ACJ71F_20615 [Nitrososphaeraceae archaeon]
MYSNPQEVQEWEGEIGIGLNNQTKRNKILPSDDALNITSSSC